MQARSRRWRPIRPLDLAHTLLGLRHGPADPTTRLINGVFWRSSRTPIGAGTLSVRRLHDEVIAEAWGPGAEWLLDGVPELVGESDDWSQLDLSGADVLRQVRRMAPGVRLCRTRLVMESLVPACLEQRVTGTEARRAWRALVHAYGEPAPGPADLAEPRMWLPPDAAALLAVTSWDWHRFGVDQARYRAIRAAATVAARLEECVAIIGAHGFGAAGFAEAHRRLRLVPGIGQWTAAETTLRALGDPDAVSVGDFHLKNLVGYALTGAARTDDATMIELLKPWRGQRARIVRLVELSGVTPPKYGPRFNPNDIRAI
jgi:3-methyladenine DNA glycosylase/8-oxoguanine DNA glycosylase